MPSTEKRPDFDQALKRLLSQAHDGLLAMLAPDLRWRGERSPELPAVSRRADLVWEVEGRGGWRGLLHIELQIKVERAIGERLAEYAIRLWRRDRLPVRSIVIFLRRGRKAPQSPFVIDWMGDERLRFSFDVIRLWEMPAERVLALPHPEIWPLAGLMEGMTLDRIVAVGEQIAASALPKHEQSELEGLLALLANARHPLRVVVEALRRSPMIDELMEEAGWAALFTEMGMRKSVRLAMEGRFGALDEALRTAIEGADEPVLEAVLRHVGTESLEQLRARLGAH